MKVLMFGWEFPPHISGGLGTACYGLCKGLVSNDVDVSFVVPKVFGDEAKDKIHLVDAGHIAIDRRYAEQEQWLQKMKLFEVSSHMAPYASPEEFSKTHFVSSNPELQPSNLNPQTSIPKLQAFNFSGLYGSDLMKEVYNYALIAIE